MSYFLGQSLEKIALVNVSSILWNQSDIRALIAKSDLQRFEVNTKWKKIVGKVIDKVQKLPQPNILKEKMSSSVRHMGLEILKWMEYHSIHKFAERDLSMHVPDKYLWTLYGTIDRKETAKSIIEDETSDPMTSLLLAYIYCLEGDVQKVWENIPKQEKSTIFKAKDNPGVINEQDLVVFWSNPHEPLKAWQHLTGSYVDAFRNAVREDNKVATEYFFQKLTQSEREVCLVEAATGAPDAEVLYFLLSRMDEQKRMRVLENNPCAVWKRIFEWPWVSLFGEIANSMWDSFCTDDNFCVPLKALVINDTHKCYEYDIYQHLSQDLIERTFERFGNYMCFMLISDLFDKRDKENIKMISRATPARKKAFILSPTGIRISTKLMRENKEKLLDFFIVQCLESEHECRQYKKKLNPFKPDISPVSKKAKVNFE